MHDIANILKSARKNKGLSVKAVLAQLRTVGIDISDKTLYGWESGHRQPDADIFLALCDIYGIESFPKIKKAPSISDEAVNISKQYDDLDDHGKRAVKAILKEETARMEEAKAPEDNVIEFPKTREITFINNAFAAGPAEPDMGNLCSTIEVDAKQKGDFAIKISGDSMEPYLHDGQIAFGVRELPRLGEVGAFFLDGEFLCKQYVDDNMGNVYLLSLNRDREDCDVRVWKNANRNLICFGKILIKGVKGPLSVL